MPLYICMYCICIPAPFLSNAHVSVGSRYARTNVYIYLALKITYVLQRERDYILSEKFFMHVKIRNLEQGNSHYLSRFFRSIIIEKINKKYTRWPLCVLISRNLSEIVFQILKIGSHANMVWYKLIFIHARAPCHGRAKAENNNIYYAPDSGILFISQAEIWTW